MLSNKNCYITARVEEELGTGVHTNANTNAKMTNQMFVPAPSTVQHNNNNSNSIFSSINTNNNNNNTMYSSDGPDSLNATYISVVSKITFLFGLLYASSRTVDYLHTKLTYAHTYKHMYI